MSTLDLIINLFTCRLIKVACFKLVYIVSSSSLYADYSPTRQPHSFWTSQLK